MIDSDWDGIKDRMKVRTSFMIENVSDKVKEISQTFRILYYREYP